MPIVATVRIKRDDDANRLMIEVVEPQAEDDRERTAQQAAFVKLIWL